MFRILFRSLEDGRLPLNALIHNHITGSHHTIRFGVVHGVVPRPFAACIIGSTASDQRVIGPGMSSSRVYFVVEKCRTVADFGTDIGTMLVEIGK